MHHVKLEMQNLERPRLVCSYGPKNVHLSLVTNLLPSIILDDPCFVLLKARDFAFFKDEGIFRIFKFTFCDEESAAKFKTKYDAVYSLMPLPEPINRANCTALAALEYLEKEGGVILDIVLFVGICFVFGVFDLEIYFWCVVGCYSSTSRKSGGDEDDAAAEGEEVSVGEVVVESEEEEEEEASEASSERSYELPMTQPFPEVPLMPFGTFKGARGTPH